MLKNRLICTVAALCVASPVLAQTATQPTAVTTVTVVQAPAGGFLIQQNPGEMLGSNLLNTDVFGITGERIGAVDDAVIDSDGRLLGVVVGIGGFLGIGQKDVAIAVDQLEFVMLGPPVAGAPPARTGWGAWGTRDEIQHIVVNYTREQLERAPEFTRLAQVR